MPGLLFRETSVIKSIVRFGLLLTCCLTLSVYAELYQWTDAQGQTHFSDKKPDAANSKTLDLPDGGAMRDFAAQPAQPKAFSTNSASRLLLVKPAQLALAGSGKADPVIGNYHFGPDCVSPSSITLNDWRQRYPDTDPLQHGDYAGAALEELGRNGFSSLSWINTYPLQPTNVMLDVTITDMQLLACARKTKLDGKYNKYDFKHSAARLGVKWTFRNGADNKIIYESSTEGVANIPANKIQLMDEALIQAFRDALLHLLEDASIGDLMTLPATATSEPASTDSDWLGQATQLPKALYDRYVQTSKLAEIIALLGTVKMVTTEYYLSNGEWPGNLEQVQLPATGLSHPDRIASVILRGHGEIVADISPAFGTGSQLMLIPSSTMAGTAIKWRCAANLQSTTLQQWLAEKCGH